MLLSLFTRSSSSFANLEKIWSINPSAVFLAGASLFGADDKIGDTLLNSEENFFTCFEMCRSSSPSFKLSSSFAATADEMLLIGRFSNAVAAGRLTPSNMVAIVVCPIRTSVVYTENSRIPVNNW